VLQGVGSLFELREVAIETETKPVFLFVGRGIDHAKLKADLLA